MFLGDISSVTDALSDVTKWPLSENADSDGSDDPIIIRVSRESTLRAGNRVFPAVLHHITASLQVVSGCFVIQSSKCAVYGLISCSCWGATHNLKGSVEA
jgi:hypothetical protein